MNHLRKPAVLRVEGTGRPPRGGTNPTPGTTPPGHSGTWSRGGPAGPSTDVLDAPAASGGTSAGADTPSVDGAASRGWRIGAPASAATGGPKTCNSVTGCAGGGERVVAESEGGGGSTERGTGGGTVSAACEAGRGGTRAVTTTVAGGRRGVATGGDTKGGGTQRGLPRSAGRAPAGSDDARKRSRSIAFQRARLMCAGRRDAVRRRRRRGFGQRQANSAFPTRP